MKYLILVILTAIQLSTLQTIQAVARDENFDQPTLTRMAYYESSFNQNAVGNAGEIGVLQFKKKTWKWLSEQSGTHGDIHNVVDQAELTIWAIRHGYGKWWSTYTLAR